MKVHGPKICTEWQFDNKVGFYKEAEKEDIDSRVLSKCKGAQLSLFSVYKVYKGYDFCTNSERKVPKKSEVQT